MAEPQHVPVLLEESLNFLNVRPGGVVVDARSGLAATLWQLQGGLEGRAG